MKDFIYLIDFCSIIARTQGGEGGYNPFCNANFGHTPFSLTPLCSCTPMFIRFISKAVTILRSTLFTIIRCVYSIFSISINYFIPHSPTSQFGDVHWVCHTAIYLQLFFALYNEIIYFFDNVNNLQNIKQVLRYVRRGQK